MLLDILDNFPHETALLIEMKPDVITQIDINVYMYTNI